MAEVDMQNGFSGRVVTITSVKFCQNAGVKTDENILKPDTVFLKDKNSTDQGQWWNPKCWVENKQLLWTFQNVENGLYMCPDWSLSCSPEKNNDGIMVRTTEIPFKWKVKLSGRHYTISTPEPKYLKAVERDMPLVITKTWIGDPVPSDTEDCLPSDTQDCFPSWSAIQWDIKILKVD